MEGLTMGRIVHFVQQLEGQVGTVEYAAIVSRAYAEAHPDNSPEGSMYDWHDDGDVDLFAFMENSVIVRHGVPFNAEKAPNTWHWIERA